MHFITACCDVAPFDLRLLSRFRSDTSKLQRGRLHSKERSRVEAGRVELPSEIAPWETSTCLVFRIDLIHLTPGDLSQINQFIVFLFAQHEQPDEPVYVIDALMQNHRQILHRTGCRQLSSSHIAVIGTYCFFQVFKEIPGPPRAV